jgi:ElaB/YqjD/DUF883 family membrane-anchored ribosome-binding protein
MDDTSRGLEDQDVSRRTSRIRSEIEQTRDELTETIDAIQDKLSPGNLVADAKERVKSAASERIRDMTETATETAQSMMEYGRYATDRMSGSVAQNPIPAALVGVGAAWLIMNRAQSSRDVRWRGRPSQSGFPGRAEYVEPTGFADGNTIPAVIAAVGLAWLAFAEGGRGRSTAPSREDWSSPDDRRMGARAEETLSRVGDSASQLAARAQEYADDVTERAQDYATGAADALRSRGRQAQNELQRMMYERPWLVGAGALAAGAAIGLALPETERENEWLGQARDGAVDKAQDMARQAVSNVQEVAGDMAGDIARRVVKGEPS